MRSFVKLLWPHVLFFSVSISNIKNQPILVHIVHTKMLKKTSGYAMVVHGRPKTPKNKSFLGSPSPQGSHSPYILGDTTRPGHVTCVLVWSKSDQRRLRKTLHKQTDKQTNRHYENNGHLAVNQKWLNSWTVNCIIQKSWKMKKGYSRHYPQSVCFPLFHNLPSSPISTTVWSTINGSYSLSPEKRDNNYYGRSME